jgi:hypothetical protein
MCSHSPPVFLPDSFPPSFPSFFRASAFPRISILIWRVALNFLAHGLKLEGESREGKKRGGLKFIGKKKNFPKFFKAVWSGFQ